MSVSRKQRRANRRNARHSTGPKSERGKAIVSRNAITPPPHPRRFDVDNLGDITIDSPYFKEEIADYQALLNSLVEELHPSGIFQQMLVQKIANCLWRSRRAMIAETAQINYQLAWTTRKIENGDIPKSLFDESGVPIYPFRNESERTASLAGREVIPDVDACNNIMRYEMRLDRQMTRAYKLLRHLQFMEQSPPDSLDNDQ